MPRATAVAAAVSIKSLRQELADLNASESKLRTEMLATYKKARDEKRSLTDAEKSRDDEIKAEVAKIDVETNSLAEQIQSAERVADIERGAPARETAVTSSVRESVQDDPKRGFKNFGEFALAVKDAGPSPQGILDNPKLMAAAGDGMSQGVSAEGGVLVPPAFSTDVWDGARVASDSMLQYTDVHQIDLGVQSVTFNGVAETSRANGSRWGGVQGFWKSELTQMAESKPKFRDVKIEPQELYVFAYVSDKLLRHAPQAASGILTRAAADEINFKLGDSIFRGTGSGMPLGFLGHTSVVSVAKENGQGAATILKANIDKMWSRCHGNWRRNAVWFINQDCEPALEELAANVGTGGVPVYLPAGGITETPNARLKGRPVILCEYSETLGTVGDIVLANLASYCAGIRGMVDQSSSMHLKFDFAQTAFRFIFEADGQPWMNAPITPFKGTKTTSPIVTLDTRG